MKTQLEGSFSKAFKSKIQNLNDFIRPAFANSQIISTIHETNRTWAMQVTQVLEKHYLDRISELKNEIMALDLSGELFRAIQEKALFRARKNFGKKLQDSTIQEFQIWCSNQKSKYEANVRATNESRNEWVTVTSRTHHRKSYSSTAQPPKQTRAIRGYKDPLSNFYPCEIRYQGTTFRSLEHAFQHEKALFFDQFDIAEKIFHSTTALEAKRLTERFPQTPSWLRYVSSLMYRLLELKFDQVQAFREALLNNAGWDFEHTITDSYWGRNLNGSGLNMFGKLLSQVLTNKTSTTTTTYTGSEEGERPDSPIPPSRPTYADAVKSPRTSPASATGKTHNSKHGPRHTPKQTKHDHVAQHVPEGKPQAHVDPTPQSPTPTSTPAHVHPPTQTPTQTRTLSPRCTTPPTPHTPSPTYTPGNLDVSTLGSGPVPPEVVTTHAPGMPLPGMSSQPTTQTKPTPVTTDSTASPVTTTAPRPLPTSMGDNNTTAQVTSPVDGDSSAELVASPAHTVSDVDTGTPHRPHSTPNHSPHNTPTNTRRPGKTNIHTSTRYKLIEWSLPEVTHDVLIIGDSNLSRITEQVDDIQIECFPGAKVNHIKNLVEKYPKKFRTPKTVILSIGINDRSNSVHTTIPNLKKMVNAIRKRFPGSDLWFPLINVSNTLPEHIQENMKALNKVISTLDKITHIPHLPQKQFRVQRDGIHWCRDTANSLLYHWLSHLN